MYYSQNIFLIINLATFATKKFKHTDSTLRGPNAYEDGKAKDTAETFGAQTNPAYSTLDRNTRDDAKYQEDPGYATPDIMRKVPHAANVKGYDDIQTDPGYETPGLKRKEMNKDDDIPTDPEYETPDFKRKEINEDDAIQTDPGYETADFKRKEMNTPGHSILDDRDSDSGINRVEVNGDLYALPNKARATVKVKRFRLTADINEGNYFLFKGYESVDHH